MKTKKEEVLSFIKCSIEKNAEIIEFSTAMLADNLNMQRTNISTILNQLVNEQILIKTNGRPVTYKLNRSLKLGEDTTVFSTLIGYHGSLKYAIQTAKAAVLYPDERLNILLMAEKGSGISCFAKAIYDFAVEKNILRRNAPFLKLSCSYYLDHVEELKNDVFDKANGILYQAVGGVLFVDHIHLLPAIARRMIHDLITASTTSVDVLIIFSSNNTADRSLKDLYFDKIPIKIELPNLNVKPLSERFEFIQRYFLSESTKVNQTLHVEAAIMCALLLYPCEGNFKQLQTDLRVGCANAFVRNHSTKNEDIYLMLRDFPLDIQKGLLSYKYRAVEVDKLMILDYCFAFSNKTMNRYENRRTENTIFDWTLHNVIDLNSSNYEMEFVETASDLEYEVQKYIRRIEEKFDSNTLSKVVDRRLLKLTETFLSKSSVLLNKIFPISIFHSVCLYVTSALSNESIMNTKVNEAILIDIKKDKALYDVCMQYFDQIKDWCHKKLTEFDLIFITKLLTQENGVLASGEHPILLIAMHGENTASSLVDTIKTLTGNKQIYAFDLSLDKDITKAYDDLKLLIKKIDNGMGIFMMYDMGSLRKMGEIIAEETGIQIRYLISPMTTLAMECAQKISTQQDMALISDELQKSYYTYYPFIIDNYKRSMMKNIIITLCLTGKGGAIQIKQYLDRHLDINNAEIIPFAMNNKNQLIDCINQLKDTHNILYIIGVENPNLFEIPFIPVSQIYSLPSNKLSMLLSIGGANVVMKGKIEYNRICNNLKDELPGLDIDSMKRLLPDIISQIETKYTLNQDQRIGLFMHIAGTINRLCCHEVISPMEGMKEVLKKNKKLLYFLHEIMKPIESCFKIQYSDTELVGLILILKRSNERV